MKRRRPLALAVPLLLLAAAAVSGFGIYVALRAEENSENKPFTEEQEFKEFKDLPKGAVLCQQNRQAGDVQDPLVCPGDTFNPYERFRLYEPLEAFVVVTDPGGSGRALERIDLALHDPRLMALLGSLNTEATLVPIEGEPDDAVTLSVLVIGADGDYTFRYSPSEGSIQLPMSNGQFVANEEFRAEIDALLSAQ
jgi:hypothetical protein